ncbi:MAG: hypothetical protein ACRCZI_06660 [Cetobacterium sp.]
MKTVMTNAMVAHTWANQLQSEGCNSNGSLYFKGTTIFSYGSHCPIATIHTRPDGQSLTLFNSRSYSSTTTQHQAKVFHAMHGAYVSVPHPWIGFETDFNHKRNLTYLENQYLECCRSALTSITHTAEIAASRTQYASLHHQYRTFFNLTVDAPAITAKWLMKIFPKRFQGIISDHDALKAWTDEVKKRTKYQAEKAEAQHLRAVQLRVQREAREAAEDVENIARWLEGSAATFGFHLPVYLRLKPSDSGIVETSRGAEIPTDHALRLWKRVQEAKQGGRTYQRNGRTEYAGVFAVESIDAQGTLIAGCHTIRYEQMEAFATKMNWS